MHCHFKLKQILTLLLIMSTESSDGKENCRFHMEWTDAIKQSYVWFPPWSFRTAYGLVCDGNIRASYFYRASHSDGTAPICFSPLMELLLESAAWISVSGIPALMLHKVTPSQQNGVCVCWFFADNQCNTKNKCQKNFLGSIVLM